jgi:hypothetical protein
MQQTGRVIQGENVIFTTQKCMFISHELTMPYVLELHINIYSNLIPSKQSQPWFNITKQIH